jgi:cell division control protein 12
MYDLVESTNDAHFEQFRSKALLRAGVSDSDSPDPKAMLVRKMKEDEDALRKRFTEQVRMEETRFKKWEQTLIAERDRLNRDLEDTHRVVKELEGEVDELTASNR